MLTWVFGSLSIDTSCKLIASCQLVLLSLAVFRCFCRWYLLQHFWVPSLQRWLCGQQDQLVKWWKKWRRYDAATDVFKHWNIRSL